MTRVDSEIGSSRLASLIDAFGNGDEKLTADEVRAFQASSQGGLLAEAAGIDEFQARSERMLSDIAASGPLRAPPPGLPDIVRFRGHVEADGTLVSRIKACRRMIQDPTLFQPKNAVALLRWLDRSLAWTRPEKMAFRPGEAKALFQELGQFVAEVEDRLYSFGPAYTSEHQDAVLAMNRLRSYVGDYLMINYPDDVLKNDRMPAFVGKGDGFHVECYDASLKSLPNVNAFPDVFLLSMDSGSSAGQCIKRITAEDGYESHAALVVRGHDGKHYVVEAGTGHGASVTPLDLLHFFHKKARVQIHFLRDSAFKDEDAKKAFFKRASDFVDVIRQNRNPYDFTLGYFKPPASGERLELKPDTPLMCSSLVQAFFYWSPLDGFASDAYRENFGMMDPTSGKKVAGYTPFLQKFDPGVGTKSMLDLWHVADDRTVMPSAVHSPITRTVAEVRNLEDGRLERQQIESVATAFLMNELLNQRGYLLDESTKAKALRAIVMGLHTVTFRSLLPLEGEAMTDEVLETVLTHMFAAEPFIEFLEKENEAYRAENGVGMTFYQLWSAAREAYDQELTARRAGECPRPKFTNYVMPPDLLPAQS
ncbi:MAG: hypothetical protein H6729_06205 [Deltaproteobacteria bacterium]|nr:hypothetical protein [Deltaproteobacteria bacterium]